jgi:hypothetical protein
MALNWQDVAQVRFQDTTQAAKNISDSLGSLGDPLQAVIDSQTEDRQNALDSAIAQQQMKATGMSAMASGMNAMSSYADTQYKLTPEYQQMMQDTATADLLGAQAQSQASQVDAFQAQTKAWYMDGRQGPKPTWGGFNSNSYTGNTGNTSLPTSSVDTMNSTVPGSGDNVPVDEFTAINAQFAGHPGYPDMSVNNVPSATPLDNALSGYAHTSMYPDIQETMVADVDAQNIAYIIKNFKTPDANAPEEEWFRYKQDIKQSLVGTVGPQYTKPLLDQVFQTYGKTNYPSVEDAMRADNMNTVKRDVLSSDPARFRQYSRKDYISTLGEAEGTKLFESNNNIIFNSAMDTSNKTTFTHPNPSNPIAKSSMEHRTAYSKFKKFSEEIAGLPASTKKIMEDEYFRNTGVDKSTVTDLLTARKHDQSVYSKNLIATFTDPDTPFTSIQMGSMLHNLVKHGGYESTTQAYQTLGGKFVTQIVSNIEKEFKDTDTTEEFADRILVSQTLQDSITGYATDIGLGYEGTKKILELVNLKLNVSKRETNYNAQLDDAVKNLATAEKKITKSKSTYNSENFNKYLKSDFKLKGGDDVPAGAMEQTGDVFNLVQGFNPDILHNSDIFYKILRKFNPNVDLDGTDSTSDLEFGSKQAGATDFQDYSMRDTSEGGNQDLYDRLSNKNLYDSEGALTDAGNALAKELMYGETPPGVLAKNNLFRTDEEDEQVLFMRLLTRYALDNRKGKLNPYKSSITSIRNKLIAR